jgi:hypothetical protein
MLRERCEFGGGETRTVGMCPFRVIVVGWEGRAGWNGRQEGERDGGATRGVVSRAVAFFGSSNTRDEEQDCNEQNWW